MASRQLAVAVVASFVGGGALSAAAVWRIAERTTETTRAAEPSASAPPTPVDHVARDATDHESAPSSPANRPAATPSAAEAEAAPPQAGDLFEDSSTGVSLGSTLQELEERYRALLARADALEQRLEDRALREAHDPWEERTQESESSALDDESDDRSVESSPQDMMAAPARPVAVAQTSTDEDSAEPTAATPPLVVTTQLVQQQTIVVQQFQPFESPYPPQQTRTTSPTSASADLSQRHQRALRQPWTSTRVPHAGGARTPWDPIDMSKHHNPWSGSRLP